MYVYILTKTKTKDPYKFEHFLSIKSEKKQINEMKTKTNQQKQKDFKNIQILI